jgi:hypothetical protein
VVIFWAIQSLPVVGRIECSQALGGLINEYENRLTKAHSAAKQQVIVHGRVLTLR